MAQSEIVATYNAMLQEQQARESKISELDNDKHDHKYVLGPQCPPSPPAR